MARATHYYDEELLGCLGLSNDIQWLFARGSIGHFIGAYMSRPYLQIPKYTTR